jgi:hypothetical protein
MKMIVGLLPGHLLQRLLFLQQGVTFCTQEKAPIYNTKIFEQRAQKADGVQIRFFISHQKLQSSTHN